MVGNAPLFKWGVFSNSNMTLSGNAGTDSYNSERWQLRSGHRCSVRVGQQHDHDFRDKLGLAEFDQPERQWGPKHQRKADGPELFGLRGGQRVMELHRQRECNLNGLCAHKSCFGERERRSVWRCCFEHVLEHRKWQGALRQGLEAERRKHAIRSSRFLDGADIVLTTGRQK